MTGVRPDGAQSPNNAFAIARRFCGPPTSGNGGYTAGRFVELAGLADIPATVTLRKPPPLETPLRLALDGEHASLRLGEATIAEAERCEFMHDLVAPVPLATARAAQSTYAGLDDHSFDGCFVCGPGRRSADGMRLFPGQIASGATACSWTPDSSLADRRNPADASYEFVWAALDCPGGWTSDLTARPLVLGRMTAVVERRPTIGSTVVIVARLLETRGRKTFTAVAAYDSDERLVGRAEQIWIEVDPSVYSSDRPRQGA